MSKSFKDKVRKAMDEIAYDKRHEKIHEEIRKKVSKTPMRHTIQKVYVKCGMCHQTLDFTIPALPKPINPYEEDLEWLRESVLPEATKGSHFYGVPLEEYTKEDLIRLVCMIGTQMQENSKDHADAIDRVMNLFKSK